MTSFRKQRPNAKYVVWSRIDQKSCFKSIYHAGFEPIIVDLVREGDALVTDVQSIARVLEERGKQAQCFILRRSWKGRVGESSSISKGSDSAEKEESGEQEEIPRPHTLILDSSLSMNVSFGKLCNEFIIKMMEIRIVQIVCVMTTTSCFAPRSPDNLPAIARICAEHGVPHLVNNAYGVQSEHCCRLLNEVKIA